MPHEGIAIVGLGCLFPGAHTPGEFWRNLLAERDCTSLATPADMGVEPEIQFAANPGEADKTYCLRGGYVRSPAIDATGFALPPEAVEGLDEAAKWTLYVAREALLDAGRGQQQTDAQHRCGLVLGNLSFPTKASQRVYGEIYARAVETALAELLQRPGLRLPRLGVPPDASARDTLLEGTPAGRAGLALGLEGPCFCIDAACASSLYAVKLAADYLFTREVDLMLAGAVSCADPLFISHGFSLFHAYPEQTSHSRPLDQSTGGLIAGEGAGMFVLKRESDAVRDGNRIYAILRGAGLSSDGRGKHLLAPNSKGQAVAMRRAYADAGLSPTDVDYVECHATGTPVGDVIELDSMSEVFSPAQPLLGSVKSNLGHLLTAAGMAGMTKIILAMANEQIPATIRVEAPLESHDGTIGAERIVRTATPWPNDGPRKRAGVSAFGFGGTNAHVVLESPGGHAPERPALARSRLAITGLGAHFAGCAGLSSLSRALFDGEQLFRPVPAGRWKGLENRPEVLDALGLPEAPVGAYVEGFELDFLGFGVPPELKEQPLPQQLLMLSVADEAIRDAGLKAGSNVAVLVAMGIELELHRYRGRVDLGWQVRAALAEQGIRLDAAELSALEALVRDSLQGAASVNQYVSYIGNIMASRIAASWDFTGPAFTVSSGDNSAFQALDVAQLLLSRADVDAVVLGAVDLAGGLESVIARHRVDPLDTKVFTMSHDARASGWLIGEGAGALVLRRADVPIEGRVYATVDAVALARTKPSDVGEGLAAAAARALASTGTEPSDVGFLELNASGLAGQDGAEIEFLRGVYSAPEGEPGCALGSSKASLGHTRAASGMVSLIRTVLCLHERYVPGTPGWHGPRDAELWARSGWYVPTESRPWLTSPAKPRRVAAINCLGDGCAAHAILSEAGSRAPIRVAPYLQQAPVRLFVVGGADEASLLAGVDDLERSARAGAELTGLAAAAEAGSRDKPLKVALVAASCEELLKEIDRIRTALPQVCAVEGEWSTPTGSYFTASPLAAVGQVAFVYSGGISSYVGLGRRLQHTFPMLMDTLEELSSDPGAVLADRLLYPRSATALAAEDIARHEAQLLDDAFAVGASSSSFALQTTAVLRDIFGVQPAAAFGFSLGEASMMIALGVWHGPDIVQQATAASKSLSSRLCGPKDAARDFWCIESDIPPDDAWATHLLLATPDEVSAALDGEGKAFLTITGAPREVFLSGETNACRRVIEKLGRGSTRAPYNYVLHCPAAESEIGALERMYTLEVVGQPKARFYTAANYGPVELSSRDIARGIATTVCRPLDFPRLVRRVYADGARVFVELGPGGTCARWIRATLDGQPHIALSVDQKGVDERTSVVRALARLVSHGVALELAPLFEPEEPLSHAAAGKAGHVRRIIVGGPPLWSGIVTDDNVRRFRDGPAGVGPAHVERHHPASTPAVPVAAAESSVPAAMPVVIGLGSIPALDSDSAPATQRAFLSTGHEAVLAVGALISQHIEHLREAYGGTSVREAPLPAPAPPALIWDQAGLLEFAGGSIANVFGPDYSVIDSYRRRVRLPLPPYLLVSRVTRLRAERGVFEPASITTEYDIPVGSWYSVDGQVSWAVAVESGQCDLLLISYLGIDFENRGDRVYRLLDCGLTFTGQVPMEGQTLRYDITIDSYSRTADNLLFFFHYDCFADGVPILKMDGGCAGFFSDAELQQGRGVVYTEAEIEARAAVARRPFEKPLDCTRTSFDASDLDQLSAGNLAAVFGAGHDNHGRNRSLRLPPAAIRMIDRVVSIDADGGPWGLGTIVAEKDLAPDHWYFPCHFKDDEVLAGSLMTEGCVQLMQLYLLYLGFHTRTVNARFQPIADLRQVVRCRGQVTPEHSLLTYRMEITDLGFDPEPYATANVEVWAEGKMVVHFKDLGMRLVEDGTAEPAPVDGCVFEEHQIEDFATGSLAACFGPEYSVYDRRSASRQPNGDLKFISRVLGVEGTRHRLDEPASLVSEYEVPTDAWFYAESAFPEIPYSILMELALQPCGFLSAWLGSTLPYPEEEFHFRNLDGDGELLEIVDVRGKTVRNRPRLVSSVSMQGVIIQKFEFELSCEGAPFYRGSAAFGYFNREALANQVGLDAGRLVQPLLATAGQKARTLDGRAGSWLFEATSNKPHYRLAGGHMDLLDSISVLEGGGRYGLGYVYGRKTVDPFDWFYANHFYQDPVMPGSLGVEAMVEALQAFARASDVGSSMRSPRFGQPAPHTTVWKYRGQIVPRHRSMSLELHIKECTESTDGITVVADGSLWRDDLRIYEVTDLAVRLAEAQSR